MNGVVTDREFTRNFLVSLGAHFALILIAYSAGDILNSTFRNKDVEIIRSAVRVDVVGMPKFTVQELKAMQRDAAPPEPEVAKSKPEVAAKDDVADVVKAGDLVIPEAGKEKKKNSFMNLISDYSSKKVVQKKKVSGNKEGKGNKQLEALIVEGNRISKGSALVGDFSDQANSEFAAYVQTLPELVRVHWKLPSYLMNKDLRCRIRIYLSNNGQVLKLEVQESSGQPEFDARAEKAVRDAAPFPAPSTAVGQRLADSGIILGFPL